MTIKELSEKTNLSSYTIRYYESVGLIQKAKRNSSGYREYDERAVIQIKMIAKAKELGFTLKEIKELSKLLYSKGLTRKKMAEQLEIKNKEIDEKIDSLKSMKNEINNALKGLCEYKDYLG